MAAKQVLTKDDFLGELRAYIARNHITQTAAADYIGVSRSYLSKVVKGVIPPNQDILDAVGYKRNKVELYEKV